MKLWDPTSMPLGSRGRSPRRARFDLSVEFAVLGSLAGQVGYSFLDE